MSSGSSRTEGNVRELNNYLQSRGEETDLVWKESRTDGANPQWSVICEIKGVNRGSATNAKKNVAKDEAAGQALVALDAK